VEETRKARVPQSSLCKERFRREDCSKERVLKSSLLKKRVLKSSLLKERVRERIWSKPSLFAPLVPPGLPSIATSPARPRYLAMDSMEETGAGLFEEAQTKSRAQLQSYLKGNGYAAKGTTELLRSRYLQARKIECGIDETLAGGGIPQKKSTAKKKRVMIMAAKRN
jgi:hypothetical protein